MKSFFCNSLLFICLVTGQVFADSIYKCVTADGKTIYQETPCRTENHKLEIEIPEYSDTSEKESMDSRQSTKVYGSLADRLYLERKIKECDKKIDSLKKSRQAKVDYWRGVMMYQVEPMQVDKIDEIIESVKEDYQRKIDIKIQEKNQFKEKLRNLDE